jgi:TPR repeat protein
VEITGKVIAVNGNALATKLEGELTPNAGDKAEIFFKLDGVDGEISVATGSVQKVGGDSIELKIERATGEVAKGQLVRIISPMAQKRADAETAYELGLQYFRGGGEVLIDYKKSFESFQRGAEQNLPEAQARLAELWSQRGWFDFIHAPDAAKAADLAKRALAGGLEAKTDAGKHQSKYELGSLYLYGLGVQKDEGKAARLFEEAAIQGNKDAKRALGFLYMAGAGVTKDPLAAEKYLKEAATENIAPAQLLLGILYASGNGTLEKSEDKAAALFQQATNQGLPTAMDKLAESFEKGSGVQQNLTKAVEWYQKAADRGLWSSQQKLGEMYEQGRGVTKDLAKAAEYYQKVADQDMKQGKDALERLRATGLASPPRKADSKH